VGVVGAGLAGLVAARTLADAGCAVRLFEREPTPGGRVRSVREDGFVFDRGFQVLFTAYPEARRQLDYDALSLRAFAPGVVVCRPNHRAVLADPLGDPRALVETLFNTDVTLDDKLRLFRLRRAVGRADGTGRFADPDASIAEALRSFGFSEAFVRNVAAPLYGGITLDRSLSTDAAVLETTLRMLAAGRTVVPADGMGAIAEQLADAAADAGVTVETDTEVTAVEGSSPTEDSVTPPDDSPAVDGGATVSVGGETLAFDAVVVATDPPTARALTGVRSIPTEGRGCSTQYYRLPTRSWPGTRRRLLLNAGSEAPNQVVAMSEVAPGYAPDDSTLLAATFLDDREETDAELAALSRDALSSWFPELSMERLETVHTARVPFAQFAQPPGVFDGLPDVRDPAGAVYLAGDYTETSSINGALSSGRAAAEAVLDDLQVPS